MARSESLTKYFLSILYAKVVLKRILFISLLLLSIGCAPKKNKGVVKDLVYPQEGFFATDFKYHFFGRIGYDARSFQEDTLLFPPIEGLVHQSVYAMCPTDTCVAEYAVLALRCPPIQPLLDWMADTVNTFANDSPIGNGLLTYNNKELDIPNKYFSSAGEICDYYMDHFRYAYDNWQCTGEGDHNMINEQAGLLLADCWHTNNLYTFYRIDWYDWLSGGNNARESWWTVDATTGKLLGLDDLVVLQMRDSLTTLMMPRLVNGKGEYLIQLHDAYLLECKDILGESDGCALLPEGLVIYYYPYNLGSGAEGEFEAVIPYDELEGILITYPASLCLDEQVNRRKSEMLTKAQQCPSNAARGEFITNATVAQEDAALSFQTKVLSALPASAVATYKAERESFAKWYAYQQAISEEVIGDIWALYAGGTAGSSFQDIHLYDIANANTAEQGILYDAMTGKSSPQMCHKNASFSQIDSTKLQLCLEFSHLYFQHENVGPDGYPAVKNTPEQLEAMLAADLDLFKKWISNRDALEPLLDKEVRNLYASNTAYLRYLCQKKYQDRFIGE